VIVESGSIETGSEGANGLLRTASFLLVRSRSASTVGNPVKDSPRHPLRKGPDLLKPDCFDDFGFNSYSSRMQTVLSILFCVSLIGVPWAAVCLPRRTNALVGKGILKRKTWMIASLVGLAAGLALSFVWYAPDETHRVMGVPFPVAGWEQISGGTWIPFPSFIFMPFNVFFGLGVFHLGILWFKGCPAK